MALATGCRYMEVLVGRTKISEQLKHLFDPRTIAVIGASNTKVKWGYIVPANILAGGFKGNFYPVNPHDEEILDHKVFKSVMDIPGTSTSRSSPSPHRQLYPWSRSVLRSASRVA